jgi:hypothetical protein
LQEALARQFPTDVMMGRYQRVWDTVDDAVDEEERQLMQEESKQLRQFFDERWKEHNIQVRVYSGSYTWRCSIQGRVPLTQW